MTVGSADISPRTRAAFLLIALLLLTGIIFGPAIGNGFVAWDDQQEIYFNPDFHPPSWEKLKRNWTQTEESVWMPLTYYAWGAIALMAQQPPDANGIKLNAGPFHAASVAAHLLAVMFVFLILRRMLRLAREGEAPAEPKPSHRQAQRESRPPGHDVAAYFGAALFALHPLQVESVAWASELTTALSGALFFAAIDQYLRLIDSTSRRRWIFSITATVCYILALLTKPTAMILPAVILVIHLLLIRRRWKTLAVMLATWIPLAVADFWIAKQFQPAENVPSLPMAQRFFVAGDALGFYAAKLFVPIHVLLDYGRTPQSVLGAHQVFWIIAVAMLIADVIAFRRARLVCAGIAIFVLGVGPLLGLVKFDYQFYSTVADRYVYLAMFGASLIIASILTRWRRTWLYAITGVCLFALALLSFIQVQRWRDTRALMEYTESVRPDSYIANKVLGLELSSSNPSRAERHFRTALAAHSDDAVVHYNYAGLLVTQGKLPQAIEQWRQTIAIKPDHYRALNNLGVACMRQKQYDQAADFFRRSIEASEHLREPFADPHVNLAMILAGEGQNEQAAAELELALRIEPNLAKARRALDALRKNSHLVP
jgi:Tfp pilus assembly protein PilF